MEAVIRRLQRTNICPLDTERFQIDAMLTAHTAYSQYLAEQRAYAEKVPTEIEEEERHIRERAASMKQVLHPLRKLPNEVIYEMVSFVIEEVTHIPFDSSLARNTPWTDTDVLDVKHHPLWICSHVCQQWRDVVLKAPYLWSRIVLPLTHTLSSFASSLLVRTLIERSKALPLYVYIRDSDAYLSDSLSLSELFAQCHRWEALAITTSCAALEAAFQHSPCSFPLLDTLFLRITRAHSDTSTSFTGFLAKTPALRVAYLGELKSCHERVPLPWAQLTHVEWNEDSTTCETSAALLRKMSSLESVTLSLRGSSEELPDLVFANESLQYLEINFKNHLHSLISALRLPKLEGLTISSLIRGATSIPLCPLPISTGGTLKELTVTQARLCPEVLDGLESILRTTPLLTSLWLTLEEQSFADDFISLLHVANDKSEHIVPALVELGLLCDAGLRLKAQNVNIINDLILSRRCGVVGVAELEYISVNYWLSDADSDELVEMRRKFCQFVDDGLDGHIMDYSGAALHVTP